MSNTNKNHHRKVKHHTNDSGYVSGNKNQEPVVSMKPIEDKNVKKPSVPKEKTSKATTSKATIKGPEKDKSQKIIKKSDGSDTALHMGDST